MKRLYENILIAGLSVTGLAAVVGTGLAVYYLGEHGEDDLVRVVDSLQPDASWKLVSENINPDRRVCLSGKCNTISRTWEKNQPPSKSDYVNMLDKTGWDYELDENCSVDRIEGDGVPRCDIETVVGEYLVTVKISYGLYGNKSQLSVGARERGAYEN